MSDTLTLDQVIELAKKHSPFYQRFYGRIPANSQLSDLPVASSWEMERICSAENIPIYDSRFTNGICFSSSGTTGVAKSSFFDRAEWRTNNQLIAIEHFKNRILRENDVVANLAYAGHASFMAVHGVIDSMPVSCAEVAIGADRNFEDTVELCEKFGVNVITGVYSAFLGLADHLIREKKQLPLVRELLGGGELLYGSQAEMIRAAFPNARILPFIFGSTDVGLIGYGAVEGPISQFHCFNEICHVEILHPENHQVLTKPHERGILVVTNLIRTGAPVSRYWNGDYAHWIDSSASSRQKFEYLGRYHPKVAVGDVTISASDVSRLVSDVADQVPVSKIQLQIEGSLDEPRLVLYFAVFRDSRDSGQLEKCIKSAFDKILPALKNIVQVRQVDFSHFWSQVRKRGKFLVDERLGQ